jgi:hypothetical protein
MLAFNINFTASGDLFNPGPTAINGLRHGMVVLGKTSPGDLISKGRMTPFRSNHGMIIFGPKEGVIIGADLLVEYEERVFGFVRYKINSLINEGAERFTLTYQIYTSDEIYSMSFLNPSNLEFMGKMGVALNFDHLYKTSEDILKLVRAEPKEG